MSKILLSKATRCLGTNNHMDIPLVLDDSDLPPIVTIEYEKWLGKMLMRVGNALRPYPEYAVINIFHKPNSLREFYVTVWRYDR